MGLASRLPRRWKAALRRIRGRIARWRDPSRGRRRPWRDDYSLAVPFAMPLDGPAPARPIGLICHLFHPELAGEVRHHAEQIPFPTDIYVSTDTDEKRRAIAAAFDGWHRGRVTVRVCPNRGRDIAPKLVTFADAYPAHDLLLFLHGKKSLTSPIGDQWRHALFATLAGSPEIVRSILTVFDRHPQIGIVAPEHFDAIRDHLHWDGNLAVAQGLAARMGFRLTERHVLELTAGSMFWARADALRPLLDLGLSFDDFPGEHDQTRATPQHAIERLFLFACERAGYRWTKVAVPALFREGKALAVTDAAALDAAIARTRLDLLSPADLHPPR